MAEKGIVRYVSLLLDRDAARRMEQEAEASLERAGKRGSEELEKELEKGGQKGARALTAELQREFKLRMSRAQQALAEGLIDEKKFRAEGQQAAVEFNRGLSDGINKLRASGGGLTDAQYAGLASRFKPTGGVGVTAGGSAGALGATALAGRLAAPLAGLLTINAAVNEAREMIDASDELNASVRRLGGTAKLAGLDFMGLSHAARENRDEFRLGAPIANDLTGFMTQLASRAGEASRAQESLAGWLDLAAARGLTAAEAMQALEVTIRGQDEGLNRLGLANPAEIYKKWGAGADQASKDMAILMEIAAESAKVQGEWAASMETATGQADQAAQKIRDLQAEAGNAIRPLQMLTLELKVGLYEILGGIIDRLSRIRFTPGGKLYTVAPDDPQLEADLQLALRGPVANQQPSAPELPTRTEPTPEETAAAEARVKALWAHLDRWMHSQDRFDALTSMAAGVVGPEGDSRLDLTMQVVPEDQTVAMRAMYEDIAAASERAAMLSANAWQDGFALMIEEGVTVGNFFKGLGAGIASSMLQALAGYAQGQAAKNYAAAIEAAAFALGYGAAGLFPSAALAWESAATHTAAGIAWSALAGGASAGGGAMRTRSPGSTFDQGLSTAQNADREQVPITIYIDPFNPANPVHTKQVGRAMELEVRLGGRPEWVR